MESVFEFIFQIILIFPGAFFRWIIGGFRKKYSYYLDASPDLNVLVSIIIFVLIYIIIGLFNK